MKEKIIFSPPLLLSINPYEWIVGWMTLGGALSPGAAASVRCAPITEHLPPLLWL